jgi:hypothetical protein
MSSYAKSFITDQECVQEASSVAEDRDVVKLNKVGKRHDLLSEEDIVSMQPKEFGKLCKKMAIVSYDI